MKKTREEKAITLIALIISVIIMVILATISINSIYNMAIVDKATDGVQRYAEQSVKENQMMDSVSRLIGNTTKRLAVLQGEVPKELQRYVMGADGTGRNFDDLFTWSNESFLDDEESIPDASTSVVYMNVLYDSIYLEEKYNYFIYAKYKDIVYRIELCEDHTVNPAQDKAIGIKAVYVPNGMEGQLVDYSIDGTSEATKWLVLYDNGDTVDITPTVLGTSDDWVYRLGKSDPAAISALPSGSKLERGQYSYEHLVENLNTKCASLVTNLTAKRVRSIGTQFDIADTIEKYSSERLDMWATSHAATYNGRAGLVGDMNGEQDIVRMSYFSPEEKYIKYGYTNVGKSYWLASRLVCESFTEDEVDFSARVVNENNNGAIYVWAVVAGIGIGELPLSMNQQCVRPVVRLAKADL